MATVRSTRSQLMCSAWLDKRSVASRHGTFRYVETRRITIEMIVNLFSLKGGKDLTSREKRTRRQYCVHEVAHAVACLSRGIPFQGIRIFDPAEQPEVVINGQNFGKSGGRVETLDGWTLSESAEDMIIMLLAGPASTRKLTRKSWFLVNRIGSGSADYEEALPIAAARWGDKIGKMYMDKCERIAVELVKKHWQAILRIAEVLSERSYLSYTDVVQLYETSTTAPAAPVVDGTITPG